MRKRAHPARAWEQLERRMISRDTFQCHRCGQPVSKTASCFTMLGPRRCSSAVYHPLNSLLIVPDGRLVSSTFERLGAGGSCPRGIPLPVSGNLSSAMATSLRQVSPIPGGPFSGKSASGRWCEADHQQISAADMPTMFTLDEQGNQILPHSQNHVLHGQA